MTNTIVAIGNISNYKCYLNVPEEEAKARYLKEECNGPDDDITFDDLNVFVRTFEFEDSFGAYEVWA